MKQQRSYFEYLIFPIAGILASLFLPPDRLPLRILVGVVISGLGVVAADAGFRWSDLRQQVAQVRSRNESRPRAESAGRWMALSFGLMTLAAIAFSPINNRERVFGLPVALMVGGAVALWTALRYASPTVLISGADHEVPPPLQPARSNLWLAAVGVAVLLFAGEIAGQAVQDDLLRQISLPLQALFFYGGIALFVLGLGGVTRFEIPKMPALPKWSPLRLQHLRPRRSTWLAVRAWWGVQPRAEIAIVILLFMGALLVRAWNLETGLRVSVDEAIAIEGTSQYFAGSIGLVGRPSSFITTLLFPQWQGEIIRLMGHSVTSLRFASAIVGALTVVVVYFLARDLFQDRRTGLIAALLLLGFPPHIHFSRIALIHIADPLFGTLAIWFLIRGLRGNRRLDWALAGAMMGLTQYFFEAGRLFFIPLILLWIGGMALPGIVAFLRRRLLGTDAPTALPHFPRRGVFIAVLAMVMVAMPAYYAAFSQGNNTVPRLSESGGFNLVLDPFQDGLTGEELAELARRILFPFSVYVTQPEQSVFYGGDQPLLLVYVVPFFLMGMGYLFWRWRSVASILLLWVLLTAAINALLRESAVYARWHVVFPALAVVVAVGVRYLLPMLWTPRQEESEIAPQSASSSRMPFRVIAAVVVVMVAGQIAYYYQWHVPLLEQQARESKLYPDTYDAAYRAQDMPDNTDIYLIATPIPDINVPRIWVNFLTDSDPRTLRYFPLVTTDFTTEFIAMLPPDRNFAFFIERQATDTILLMIQSFGCIIEASPFVITPPNKEYGLCYVDRNLR